MRRLHDQHEQSVACFGLARIGELHGRGHRRIVDRIEHILGLVRQIMQRSRVFLRVHAHRRGIEHDMNIARNVPAAEHGNACARNGIGQLLLQRLCLLEIASRDGQIRALRHAVVCHHGSRAAIAEQQHLFTLERYAVTVQRLRKAEDVRVEAGRLAVRKADCVDRVQVAGSSVNLIEQGDDSLFVRDGAVDAAQLALGQLERFR